MLLTLVSDISAQSLVQNSGTNENRAFRWLVDDDEARVCPEDTIDVVQRYVLALLYFSTNGDDWNECNAASASDASGCASLSERYLSSANVCDWFGSECDDNVNLSEISIGECLPMSAYGIPHKLSPGYNDSNTMLISLSFITFIICRRK